MSHYVCVTCGVPFVQTLVPCSSRVCKELHPDERCAMCGGDAYVEATPVLPERVAASSEIAEAVAFEREQCARTAELYDEAQSYVINGITYHEIHEAIAAAIRARH